MLKIKKHLVLEALARFGEATTEHLIANLVYFPENFLTKRSVQSANWFKKKPIKIDIETKVRLWNTISKLKKDSLVVKTEHGYNITKSGFNYLIKNPPLAVHYKPESQIRSNKIILVIFDVPEHLRTWRDWLRLKLKELDFSLLQQSVWYSQNMLPDIFVKDLERYELLPYVHILSVNKQGTLSRWFERIGKHNIAEN